MVNPFDDLPAPKHEDDGATHSKEHHRRATKECEKHTDSLSSSAGEIAAGTEDKKKETPVEEFLNAGDGNDLTLGAIRKIAHTLRVSVHKENAIRKSLQMLCKLMQQSSIEQKHAADLFDALNAAVQEPERVTAAAFRAEFKRLFQLAASLAQSNVFNRKHKLCIDAWCLRAVTANQLCTDESYEVNILSASLFLLLVFFCYRYDAKFELRVFPCFCLSCSSLVLWAK